MTLTIGTQEKKQQSNSSGLMNRNFNPEISATGNIKSASRDTAGCNTAANLKFHYFNYLGLEKDPFSTSPDPYYFYPLSQHQSCLNYLEIAIRLKRGANLILGEIGTGKTTLCRKLLQRIDGELFIEPHLMLNPPNVSEKEFLGLLADFMGVDVKGSSCQDISDSIKNHLFLKGVEEGKTIVLIIDEAQKLSFEAIEGLRGLLNYETNEFKLLQLVLLGQLQLKDKLRLMPNFVDRLNYRMQLNPLDFKECCRLIKFRLEKSGITTSSSSVFTGAAVKAIHELSGGYPRKICMLAHKTLEQLIVKGRRRADDKFINEVYNRDIII